MRRSDNFKNSYENKFEKQDKKTSGNASGNPRGAGRKRRLSPEQLEQIRQAYAEGRTITELAKEYGISRQTLSGYLNESREVENVIKSASKWKKLNREFPSEHLEKYSMRMDYMCREELCTVILISFRDQEILIRNHTMDVIHRAFGIKEKPDWKDFEEFLEDRCFPRTRFQLQMILSDLGLDFYDPLAIIEKTQGKMAEDLQWIRIWYFRAGLNEDTLVE
ncbi:MAG: helix-turn-helix domain-containing protein [Lachnospiraceae bacterium]|nr:helix-turn-helix domain-containing protein [Lachnospiraceae bacterium]